MPTIRSDWIVYAARNKRAKLLLEEYYMTYTSRIIWVKNEKKTKKASHK